MLCVWFQPLPAVTPGLRGVFAERSQERKSPKGSLLEEEQAWGTWDTGRALGLARAFVRQRGEGQQRLPMSCQCLSLSHCDV